mmetsp:Transcript_10591/g.22510  ORF Transcript_10591/g.22510 Transcript_10591/m.22510 type:complete len:255 (-) Transcript_10591:869-1633(-)
MLSTSPLQVSEDGSQVGSHHIKCSNKRGLQLCHSRMLPAPALGHLPNQPEDLSPVRTATKQNAGDIRHKIRCTAVTRRLAGQHVPHGSRESMEHFQRQPQGFPKQWREKDLRTEDTAELTDDIAGYTEPVLPTNVCTPLHFCRGVQHFRGLERRLQRKHTLLRPQVAVHLCLPLLAMLSQLLALGKLMPLAGCHVRRASCDQSLTPLKISGKCIRKCWHKNVLPMRLHVAQDRKRQHIGHNGQARNAVQLGGRV